MNNTDELNKSLEGVQKPQNVQALIESSIKELGKALPKHMDSQRMARIALTCVRQNPELAKCSPESFLGALFTAAQLGLEPIAGRCYLLPFYNSKKRPDGSWHRISECQFVLGYKGIVELFYRHAKAKYLDWGVRHEKDEFKMVRGSYPTLSHIQADGDRGPIIGYWVMAHLESGQTFHYMTKEECLEHGRTHSKTYDKKLGKFFDSSPWVKNEEAMCLKTVLLQGAKLWPLSVDLQHALDQDETSRIIPPGVDNVLDVPSQTDWDAIEPYEEEIKK